MSDGVSCLAFSPNKKLLASGHADGMVYVYDIDDKYDTKEFRCYNYIKKLIFLPDGERIALYDEEGNIVIWNFTTDEKIYTDINYYLIGLKLSKEGNQLIAYGYNQIYVLNLNNYQVKSKMSFSNDDYDHVIISPDDTNILLCSADYLKAINADTFETLYCTEKMKYTNFQTSCIFSNDSQKIAFNCGKEIHVFNANNGDKITTVSDDIEFNSFSFSPNCQQITTCSKKTIRVWNTETGDLLKTIDTDIYTDQPCHICVTDYITSLGKKIQQFLGKN